MILDVLKENFSSSSVYWGAKERLVQVQTQTDN